VNDASGNHATKTNLKPEITGLFSLPIIGLILFFYTDDWFLEGISRKHRPNVSQYLPIGQYVDTFM